MNEATKCFIVWCCSKHLSLRSFTFHLHGLVVGRLSVALPPKTLQRQLADFGDHLCEILVFSNHASAPYPSRKVAFIVLLAAFVGFRTLPGTSGDSQRFVD